MFDEYGNLLVLLTSDYKLASPALFRGYNVCDLTQIQISQPIYATTQSYSYKTRTYQLCIVLPRTNQDYLYDIVVSINTRGSSSRSELAINKRSVPQIAILKT